MQHNAKKSFLSSVIDKYIFIFLTVLSFSTLSKADTFFIDLSSNITISPTTVEVSQQFPSYITIKNENDPNDTTVDAKDVNPSIKYHIPAGTTYNGSYSGTGWDCESATDDNGDLKCYYTESLQNGETSNPLTVNLIAPSDIGSEDATVTVEIETTDSNSDNDTSTTTVEFGKSNLQITKTASKTTLQLGEEFQYTIEISNPYNGTNPTVKARNVTVTDTLPSGISFVSLNDTSWCNESGGTITCSGSDLDVGTSRSVTITVKADSGGTKNNTASADADSSNYTPLPTSSSTSVNVELADIVLSQSLIGGIDNYNASINSDVIYRLHIVNNGATPATDVTITDTLPNGVTYNGFSDSANWDCDTSNLPTITCTLKDNELDDGESYDLDLNVKMPSTHGDITNSATAATSAQENDTSNNDSSLLTHVLGADLNIYKTPDNGTTDIGSDYTYTIKVTNNGSVDAANVVVTDTLDSKMTYKSDTDNCSRSGQTLTCDLGTISAGSNKTFQVTVTMPTDTLDDVTNSVSVTTDTDQDNTNNLTDTATTHLSGPNLDISKYASVTQIGLGKTFNYTIEVQNVNTADAEDAKITDNLPDGVTITDIDPVGWSCPSTPITGRFECTKATVAGGESYTLTFTATAPTDTVGNITNTATVSHSLNSNDGSYSVTVEVIGAELDIQKQASPTAVVGGLIDYNITVSNTSPSDAENLTLSDDLSSLGSGYTINSIIDDDGWSCSGTDTLTCTRSELTSGSSSTIHFSVNVPLDATLGSRTNTASVTTTTEPKPTESDSASTTILGANLAISKTVTPTTVGLEDSATYTITVTNNGLADATNTYVDDTLPSGFTDITTSGCNNDGSSVSGQSVHCTLGTLSNGDSKSFTISVKAPNTDGTYTNTATTDSDTPDDDTSDNTSSVDLIVKGADLTPVKAAPARVAGNSIFSYTISLRNIGYSSAYGATITDDVPTTNGTSVVSGSINVLNSDWDCSLSGSTVSCHTKDSNLEIAPNYDQEIVTFQVQTGPATYWIHNTVHTETNTSESNTANNDYIISTEVINIDLQTRKLVNGTYYGSAENYVAIGDNIDYTLQVRNASEINIGITDINVTDLLPSNLSNSTTNKITIEPDDRFDCSLNSFSLPSFSSTLYANPGDTLFCVMKDGDTNPLTIYEGWINVATISVEAPDENKFDINDEDNNSVINSYKAETSLSDEDLSNNAPTTGDGYLHTNTLVRGANMSILKTVSANPVGAEGDYSYTLEVKNWPRSSSDAHDIPSTTATNIVVKDTLPSDVTYISASGTNWSCSESSHIITCNYSGDMPPSNTASNITVNVTAPNTSGETLTNEANVTNDTLELVRLLPDNTSSVDTVTQGADLLISAISQYKNPVGAYEQEEYYVYVRNQGAAPAQDINVTFQFTNPSSEATWSNISGSGTNWSCQTYNTTNHTLTCSLSTLDSYSDADKLTIVSNAPNYNGDIINSAALTGTDSTNASLNDTKSITTTIVGSDLKIKKYVNDPNPSNPNSSVYYDDNITIGTSRPINFKLTIENQNIGLAKEVTITDTLPAGFTDLSLTSSGSWSCSISSNTLTCTKSSVDPNSNAEDILYTATTPSIVDTFTNTADINTTTQEYDTANNSDSADIETQMASLEAEMNVSKSEVGLGEIFSYILNITNTGKTDAFDINVGDTLPNGFTFVDNNGSDADWNCTGSSSSSISCIYGALPPYGANTTLILNVKAPIDQTGTFSNGATISSPSISEDINVTAPDVTVVGSDLDINITATPIESLEDRNVTYNISVKNISLSTAYDIQLGQTFSPSVSAIYIQYDGEFDCNITDPAQGIECNLSSMDYGEEKNITIIATMPHTDTLIDPFTSTATVSTTSIQEDTDNDASSVDIKVYPIKPDVLYHFEECIWNGTDGEVKDEINNINATAKNGAKTLNHILSYDDNNFSTAWRTGYFDGVDDYIDIPDSVLINLETHNKRSISLWFNSTKSSSEDQVIYEEGGTINGLAIYLRDSKLYVRGWNRSTNWDNGTTLNTTIELNKWYNVILTLDTKKDDPDVQPNTFKAYLNGVEFGSGGGSQLSSHSNDIAIGNINSKTRLDDGIKNGDHYFKGLIDEFEVYNIALDDRAVQDIYNYEKNLKNYNGEDRNQTLCGVDLKVTKTASPSPKVGAEGILNYTITVKNNSPEPLTTGFTLSDILPQGLTIIESNISNTDVTCSGDYDFNCTLLPDNILYQNDTRVITLSAVVPNSDSEVLTNSVDISTGVSSNIAQPDTDLSNNSDTATVETEGTDLSITKTATLDDNGSNLIYYTITVTNNSSITEAKDVRIFDTYDDRLAVTNYPSGISCTIPANEHYFSCQLPDIAPNETFSFTTTMQAEDGIGIINDVNVTSHTIDADLSNNHAEVSIDINTTGTTAPVKLKDGFRKHISVNNYGNMVAIGNTMLKAENQDGNTSLTDVNTSYVNIDNQPLDSSSATLNIPENNITIEYAGLYWGGHIKGEDNNDTLTGIFNTIKLKTPSGNIYNITAGDQENGNIVNDDNTTGFYRFKKDDDHISRLYYSCEANVTSIIRDEYANNNSINGVYTVSDLNISHGLDSPLGSLIPANEGWELFDSGFFGGWELIVIYKIDHRLYRSVRYKNNTIFDGFKYLMPRTPGQVVSLDINVSGFITPYSGDIESNLYSMVLAGDMTLPYESMSVNDSSGVSHLVKEGSSNTDNIFNDTISLQNTDGSPIDKNYNLAYNPGVDLDQFDLTSKYDEDGNCISSPCYLSNSQTSTMINLQVKESTTEVNGGYPAQYAFVDMLGFNTQIYTPDFIDSYKECFKKKEPGSLANNDWVPCSDPTPTIHRGSIIKYRITIINSGTDDALNVHVSDPLPKEVDFNGSCTSPNDDIIATHIYDLPDGEVTSSDDLDNGYNDTLREISGQCDSALYDYNETVRNECIEDIKAILIDGNTTVPLNTIPDGNGETLDLIDPSYNGASCSVDDDNITTLTFSYPTFPKKSVTWIEFYTVINSKAELGKSFQNKVSIDFTNQTLFSAGIDNLQTQESEPVDSGTVTFNWNNIVTVARDPGRLSVGTKIVNKPFDLNISLTGISALDIDSDGNTTMLLSNLKLVDQYNSTTYDISGSIIANTATVSSTDLSWTTHNSIYDKASKEIGFSFDLTVISGSYSETKHYPSDFNSTAPYAGDVFTTRPKSFTLSFPGASTAGAYTVIKAAQASNLNITAIDENGNASSEYDNTLSKSNGIKISLDPNFSTNPACININDLNISSLTFTNGLATTTNAKYNNVGVIKFDITDSNWTAKDQGNGDCIANSGTNTFSGGIIGCNVEGNSTSVVYKPDRLDFNNTTVSDFSNNYTYMIVDPTTDGVYGHIITNVVSKNVNGDITTFFSNTCFGDNVDVNLSYNIESLNVNDLNISIINENNISNVSSNDNIVDVGNNYATDDKNTSFLSGIGPMKLRVFADKNKTTPLQPALLDIQELNASIDNYLGITGVSVPPNPNSVATTNDIHFIYGRVHAPNYSSDTDTISAKIYYEGYCKDCNKSKFPSLGSESVDSIYWYINDQNGINDGNISSFAQPATTKITISPSSSVSISNGEETHTITYTGTSYPYSERVDMQASPWLIFNPYNPNATTNSFFVDFSKYNDWAGVGTTGKTVDLNISSKGSKRIEW